MISTAFRYKGWSNVTSWKVVARLQTKAFVGRMHALSPYYILVMGKNLNDNCSPGFCIFWCKIRNIPCKFSVARS
ncbi:hypothetical protein DPMN_145312 [Dreissena polymorpha]|uniref:Uncharacterized protein n=1 Tax=Dreissena polymorpha TaxID=45954 RepID=A0A9D4F9M3_DREPO|nr:hypothetical protein DPMN_145312 [Dreissena polymorpha]